jgi:hypothetical protein
MVIIQPANMFSSIFIDSRRRRRRRQYNGYYYCYVICAFLLCRTWMDIHWSVDWRVRALVLPQQRKYLLVPSSFISTTSTTILSMSSSSPPPRQPRRMLKKRRRRDGDNSRRFIVNEQANNKKIKNDNNNNNNNDAVTTEYRPLVSSVRRDLGEDYWIDPVELENERQRQQQQQKLQQQRQQRAVNVIPPEKLWSEVKAPYQQNWIGYFSVFIAILSMIVLKFPELLDTPTISYPDL